MHLPLNALTWQREAIASTRRWLPFAYFYHSRDGTAEAANISVVIGRDSRSHGVGRCDFRGIPLPDAGESSAEF